MAEKHQTARGVCFSATADGLSVNVSIRFCHLFIFGAWLLLSTGCAEANVARGSNFSLVSTPGCDVPCWQGIEPGVTESERILALLRQRYGDEEVRQRSDVVEWRVSDGVMGRISIVGERAGTMVFHFAEGRLSLAALVEQVGMPDTVYVNLPPGPLPAKNGAAGCEVLRLGYPQAQMEVVLYEGRSGNVRAEQSIARIYLAPERLRRSILTPYYAQAWTGFGAYCPPPAPGP